MNTNTTGRQTAASNKKIETWEQLQDRLFRLTQLGEELAAVVTGPVTTWWLYREIETEAARVAEVAGAYIDECERRDREPHGGGNRPVWCAPLDHSVSAELPGRRVAGDAL